MGNKYLRRILVESAQFSWQKPSPSKILKKRRQGIPEEYISIANRCMERLHKKGWRLISREKHRNKVKVACAREMLGFIWESLRLAEQA